MSAIKPTYAPVPARAMIDRRLSERHLRTLAVVAAHDRLGRNGIGCWASHQRLADMVGCNYNRLSMNLRELGELGYIERIPHPLNKRLRVYRVVYNEADRDAMKGFSESLPSGEGAPADCSPDGETSAADSSPSPTQFPHDSNGVSAVNIFRETGNRSGETLGRYSAEAASPEKEKTPGEVRSFLARLQAAIDRGCPATAEQRDRLAGILRSVPASDTDTLEWARVLRGAIIAQQQEAAE